MSKYRNVKSSNYRSRLEAKCAAALTEAEVPFVYEPQKITLWESDDSGTLAVQFSKQKPTTRKLKPITYLPDFTSPDLSTWAIEVKGYKTPDFNLKWKLLRATKQFKLLFLVRNDKDITVAIDLIKKYELLRNKEDFKLLLNRTNKSKKVSERQRER